MQAWLIVTIIAGGLAALGTAWTTFLGPFVFRPLLRGLDERIGEGVARETRPIVTELVSLGARIETVESQTSALVPDGGSSLADAIRRLETQFATWRLNQAEEHAAIWRALGARGVGRRQADIPTVDDVE